jgi:hypothetical protein
MEGWMDVLRPNARTAGGISFAFGFQEFLHPQSKSGQSEHSSPENKIILIRFQYSHYVPQWNESV